ncbi:helix-turn-helix domain-containing protein [Bacillus tianshenii]|uniref:helix-turn-helix domain-containing protein n=1 Tax=Sutcliffiella tianshenii TaxID=1463404 RepID=UPI001CD6DF40|nr:helix-turn-helix domain-containing protein [Bacillus tianshenii]MCA1319464.1 helix-turn-helix domain-containing protein [Bacillus tianshenii]
MIDISGVFHDVEPSWGINSDSGRSTLVFVTDGIVDYLIEGEKISLEKGELLYIPAYLKRSWSNAAHMTHKKYTVVFSNDIHQPLFSDNKEDLIRFKPRKAAYYEQRLTFLYVQWLSQRSFYREMSRNILSEILILIAQEKEEWHTSPIKEKTVRKIQEHILYNYRRNITIEELAELAGVTSNYVTVLFKEVLGVTPIQYLHQTRINTAWNLLQSTGMSVREVAEYLGYCDQSYFNRMFKKWMGMAPTHVRV